MPTRRICVACGMQAWRSIAKAFKMPGQGSLTFEGLNFFGKTWETSLKLTNITSLEKGQTPQKESIISQLPFFGGYSRWTNYSNPGQLYPPRPPNFKVVFFFQGLRRVDKINQTPQHDTSRTHSLTLTFGEGGVVQSFPRGLNILSIYGPGT